VSAGQGFVELVTLETIEEYRPMLRAEEATPRRPLPRRPSTGTSGKAHFQGERIVFPNTFAPFRRRPRTTPPAVPGSVSTPSPTTPPVLATPSLRWWKRLTISDVMRKPASSHQRNHVILGQAGHPIDQKTWFRDTFFSSVNWQPERMRTGNIKEVVNIPLEVFVNEDSQGRFSIRFDHAPNRIANQNNAPTWLQWSGLTNLIRSQNFTDWYLVLERFAPDTYRLRLSQTEPT
jgi:hypothetical protein